eukprot:280183_1
MEDIKTVFVGNLPWSVSDEELLQHMSNAGKVLDSTVQRFADTSRSKGWGLVEYETPEEAKGAIECLAGTELDGRPIHIRMDRSNIENSGGFTVFVGNIPWNVTDADLTSHFNKYEPYDAHVKTSMTGRSRGFAVLRFSDPEMGQKAIDEMNGCLMNDRAIIVREDRDVSGEGTALPARGNGSMDRGAAKAEERGDSGRAARSERQVAFVGNLSYGTSEQDLLDHFSAHETPGMESVQVQVLPNGRSRGWALVHFDTPTNAQSAIKLMHGTVLDDRHINVRLDRK